MRFVFRADASTEIGSGHVMRISVLAEEAISRGYRCIFIGKIQDLDWVSRRIGNLGFEATFELFEEYKSYYPDDVLILDSYTTPANDSYLDPSKWRLIITIEDESTPSYASNISIKPSLTGVKTYFKNQKILSGPEFALIRKSITKNQIIDPDLGLQRIIVSGGGTDVFGFSLEMAQVFNQLEANFEAHFFTNQKMGFPRDSRFILHDLGEDFDQVAEKSDIAFTTASTASVEFIAREIPTGLVCAVQNQNKYYDELISLGLAIEIGIFSSSQGWKLNSTNIQRLIIDSDTRRQLRANMKHLIDLKGPARILDEIQLELD